MTVLTGVDILGIQEYIFSSNRLSDVLSASAMIEAVMDPQMWIDGMKEVTGEIILAAGGNVLMIFSTLEDAKHWAAHFTRWLQDKAPGLEVVVAHRCYEGECGLAWAMKALHHIDLPRLKLERIPNAVQLGMSVTASCSITGEPATGRDKHSRDLLGTQLLALREPTHERTAKERWKPFLCSERSSSEMLQAEFPEELDDMGRSHGDISILGIVHVDGNGVGKKIQQWLDRCIRDDLDDAEVRMQCRAWSDQLRELGNGLLQAIVARTLKCVKRAESAEVRLSGMPEALGFPLNTNKTREGQSVVLPLRPILLGGDDFTFVCDGRLALDLAATALKTFDILHIDHLGETGEPLVLSGCAGVAFVKAHAPFHRGYELADALCRWAKKERRSYIKDNPDDAGATTRSWLDWHIGSIRPGESVEDIRGRQYQNDHLTMRPYPLRSEERLSWEKLDEVLLGPGLAGKAGFRGMPCWVKSRNRVKALAGIVAEGLEAVEAEVNVWRLTDPNLKLPAETAYRRGRSWLLDAIELLDIHLRLDAIACAPEEEVGIE